jgi:hypothetical protein
MEGSSATMLVLQKVHITTRDQIYQRRMCPCFQLLAQLQHFSNAQPPQARELHGTPDVRNSRQAKTGILPGSAGLCIHLV